MRTSSIVALLVGCGTKDDEGEVVQPPGPADTDTDTDSDTDADTDLDTADSADSATEPVECPDGMFSGPLVIVTADVACDAMHHVLFSVETEGWTQGQPAGFVFSQETGNPEPQWGDTHSLLSWDRDTCGFVDRIERELDDATHLQDPFNDWMINQSTLFNCNYHYGDPTIMTYAFAVVDPSGALADCAVVGAHPLGLIQNGFSRVMDPMFDTSTCHEGILAR